jgi:uncharacterized protein YkuJ
MYVKSWHDLNMLKLGYSDQQSVPGERRMEGKVQRRKKDTFWKTKESRGEEQTLSLFDDIDIYYIEIYIYI